MLTTLTQPDWLTLHGGEMQRGLNGDVWFILLSGSPQYRLFVTTAKGKYTCAVTQTVSGKRLDKGGNYPTTDAALAGGLEELRQVLGW